MNTQPTHEVRKHQIRGLGATKTYTNNSTGHKVTVHPVQTYNDGSLKVFCETNIDGQVRTRSKIFNSAQVSNKDEARGKTIAELLSIFTNHRYVYKP